jgi:DNA-binding Xre family transcriptional regulator
MLINTKVLRKSMNDKMFELMDKNQKRFGLRYFAKEVGISLATLARFMNFTSENIDLKTFECMCKWINKPAKDFLN